MTTIDFKAAQADDKLDRATCSQSALTRTSATLTSAYLREYPHTWPSSYVLGHISVTICQGKICTRILTHQDKFRIKNFNPDAHVVTTLRMVSCIQKAKKLGNKMSPNSEVWPPAGLLHAWLAVVCWTQPRLARCCWPPAPLLAAPAWSARHACPPTAPGRLLVAPLLRRSCFIGSISPNPPNWGRSCAVSVVCGQQFMVHVCRLIVALALVHGPLDVI
jgi:hypothetical protein